MSDYSVHFNISLTPVLDHNTQAAGAMADENSWLNNNSDNILQVESSASNESGESSETGSIDHLITNIAEQKQNNNGLASSNINNSATQADFVIDKFEIKTSSAGVFLITAMGEKLVQDKQLIAINNILYKLNISQTSSIPNQAPINQIAESHSLNPFQSGDIWQDNHLSADTNTPSNNIASFLHDTQNLHSANQQSQVQTDPLNFLYQSSNKPKTASEPSNLPYQAYENQSLPNTATQDLYGEQLSPSPALPASSPIQQDNLADQGNVLSDLGIDREASTIISQETNSNAATYSDSSPMDMLDSFLESPSHMAPNHGFNQTQPAPAGLLPYETSPHYEPKHSMTAENSNNVAHNIPYSHYKPVNKSSILGGLKNVFKKISI